MYIWNQYWVYNSSMNIYIYIHYTPRPSKWTKKMVKVLNYGVKQYVYWYREGLGVCVYIYIYNSALTNNIGLLDKVFGLMMEPKYTGIVTDT